MMRNFNRKKKMKLKNQLLLNKIELHRALGSSVNEAGKRELMD
jgi:hypothetical protein